MQGDIILDSYEDVYSEAEMAREHELRIARCGVVGAARVTAALAAAHARAVAKAHHRKPAANPAVIHNHEAQETMTNIFSVVEHATTCVTSCHSCCTVILQLSKLMKLCIAVLALLP